LREREKERERERERVGFVINRESQKERFGKKCILMMIVTMILNDLALDSIAARGQQMYCFPDHQEIMGGRSKEERPFVNKSESYMNHFHSLFPLSLSLLIAVVMFEFKSN
jgi:hypothetical protein